MDEERWRELCRKPAAVPDAYSLRVPAHVQSRLLHQMSERAWKEIRELRGRKARRRRRLIALNEGALWLATMLIPNPRTKEAGGAES